MNDKTELNLYNEIRNFVPLKIGRWDSEGFFELIDIEGKKAYCMDIKKQDMLEGFANIVLWHLEKAKEQIVHNTKENPRNDTRLLPNGDGYKVVKAIEDIIELYKKNFKVDKIEVHEDV